MSWAGVVSDELREYLEEVANSLLAGSDHDTAPDQVANVLEELRGQEVQVATDAQCSRHLEALLQQASQPHAVSLLQCFLQQTTLWQVASRCGAALEQNVAQYCCLPPA